MPHIGDMHRAGVDTVSLEPGAVVVEVRPDRTHEDRMQADILMPNAMFAATPPRRTSSSSTRKLSETLCSLSATSESENRPGKVIKWSVAIEPVTAIRTGSPGEWPGEAFRNTTRGYSWRRAANVLSVTGMSLQPLIDDAKVVQQVLGARVGETGENGAVPTPRQAAGEPPGSPGPELIDAQVARRP